MWWKNDPGLALVEHFAQGGVRFVKRHIPCSTSVKKVFFAVQLANLQVCQWILAQDRHEEKVPLTRLHVL